MLVLFLLTFFLAKYCKIPKIIQFIFETSIQKSLNSKFLFYDKKHPLMILNNNNLVLSKKKIGVHFFSKKDLFYFM